MVIYDLVCDEGHTFEGWFTNADDLSAQQKNGLLTCPYCDSSIVNKVITAPKVARKSNSTSIQSSDSSSSKGMSISGKVSVESKNLAMGGNSHNADNPEAYAKLQKMLGKVHDYIDQNFTDVGNRFTEEAISIHNGEKEPENIRGTASKEQLKELADEGVSALPVPGKPVDKDKLN